MNKKLKKFANLPKATFADFPRTTWLGLSSSHFGEVIATPFLDTTCLKKWVEDCILFFICPQKKNYKKNQTFNF